MFALATLTYVLMFPTICCYCFCKLNIYSYFLQYVLPSLVTTGSILMLSLIFVPVNTFMFLYKLEIVPKLYPYSISRFIGLWQIVVDELQDTGLV